jgi:hypothetical protein
MFARWSLSFFPALQEQEESLLGWSEAKKKSRGKRGQEVPKKEPPGETGRPREPDVHRKDYLFTIFSTMSPMTGSLNISWL